MFGGEIKEREDLSMEKSRLGISINLFAALLYFLGATGSIIVVMIAAGYVLLCEESQNLKKTAVKALILIIFLEILIMLITWVTQLSMNIIQILNGINSANNMITYMENTGRTIVTGTGSSGNTNNWIYNYLYHIFSFVPSGINYIARISGILIPVIFGFSAYRQKDIKIKWIDNIIDKHFISED
jgi:hypothetical protein